MSVKGIGDFDGGGIIEKSCALLLQLQFDRNERFRVAVSIGEDASTAFSSFFFCFCFS
jgi:hypothetical protein